MADPRIDLNRLDPKPLGFGRCADCAYRDVGSADICFACASQGMDPLDAKRCMTCDQTLPDSGVCSNYWCRRPAEERFFEWIWAIAKRSGDLKRAIDSYKYSDRKGWAKIFARVLVGYLNEDPGAFKDFDLIIGSPTFTGAGSRRTWDHIGLILRFAADEAGARWPVDVRDPPTLVKTADTESLVGKRLVERRQIAETELRPALAVPRTRRVSGKAILVFDDVFTDGSTMRELARILKNAGATTVAGIVLARQPWTW